MSNTLYAQFDDYKMAEKAIGALMDHGLDKECISLVRAGEDHEIEEHGKTGITTTTSADAASGAAKGAGVGLVAGALGALASLFVPGFGLVLGGGALATALMAMAGTTVGGAVAGGVTGFLMDQGVDEKAAHDYEEALNRGGALLAVETADDDVSHGDIEAILHKYNATNINRTGAGQAHGVAGQTVQATRKMSDASHVTRKMSDASHATRQMEGSEGSIPVVEEELVVGKREVEKGGVRIESRLVEEPVEQDVTLKEERVTVERRPVDRAATESDFAAFQEGTMELRETAEELVVDKRARVVEEVVVNKDVVEKKETVRDTVRHTDVEVHEFDADYRADYDRKYSSERGFDYYQPAYRFGDELATSREHHGRSFDEIEPHARESWQKRYPDNMWENSRDAVRYGFEHRSVRTT